MGFCVQKNMYTLFNIMVFAGVGIYTQELLHSWLQVECIFYDSFSSNCDQLFSLDHAPCTYQRYCLSSVLPINSFILIDFLFLILLKFIFCTVFDTVIYSISSFDIYREAQGEGWRVFWMCFWVGDWIHGTNKVAFPVCWLIHNVR